MNQSISHLPTDDGTTKLGEFVLSTRVASTAMGYTDDYLYMILSEGWILTFIVT